MRRSRSLAAAVAAAALLAAGCTPDPQPTASPTPSPTFTCSSSTVTDPCTPEKAQKEKEQAAAIQKSLQAYDNFLAEYNRVTRAGGAEAPTPTMRRYASGPYLDAYAGYIESVHAKGWRYSGQITSKYFRPLLDEHRTGSPSTELSFAFCQDGTRNVVTDDKGKVVGRGSLIAGKVYIRMIDGTWKLYDTDNERVSSC